MAKKMSKPKAVTNIRKGMKNSRYTADHLCMLITRMTFLQEMGIGPAVAGERLYPWWVELTGHEIIGHSVTSLYYDVRDRMVGNNKSLRH